MISIGRFRSIGAATAIVEVHGDTNPAETLRQVNTQMQSRDLPLTAISCINIPLSGKTVILRRSSLTHGAEKIPADFRKLTPISYMDRTGSVWEVDPVNNVLVKEGEFSIDNLMEKVYHSGLRTASDREAAKIRMSAFDCKKGDEVIFYNAANKKYEKGVVTSTGQTLKVKTPTGTASVNPQLVVHKKVGAQSTSASQDEFFKAIEDGYPPEYVAIWQNVVK